MRRNWRWGAVCLLLCCFAGVAVNGCSNSRDWRNAPWTPTGLAPDPATTPEALVQVYAARAVGWRGWFGVHTWVAVKPSGKGYTVFEVIGWRLRSSDSAVVVRNRTPDAPWFGAAPELIAERRGPGVDALIERIEKAAATYPWAGEYAVWPGPNSNTFTAWLLRAVPEIGADLPPTAIGKDYAGAPFIGPAPSGAGLQLSLYGLLGMTASGVEGIELNLLGLTFGLNPFDPALKLPVLGRVGPARVFSTPALQAGLPAAKPAN